jgi:hypothetical protein
MEKWYPKVCAHSGSPRHLGLAIDLGGRLEVLAAAEEMVLAMIVSSPTTSCWL